MPIFSWKNSKFKILGITIFKVKNISQGIYLYVLGIPCYKHKGKLSKLVVEIRKNKNFNTQEFDKKIESFIKPINVVKMQKNNNNIGFFATEIYDMGGHSKCIKDLILSLSNKYQQFLFLTKKSSSIAYAPNILDFIKDHVNIYGIDANLIFFRKNIKRFCDKIISTNIKTLLAYIHPDDIFGTAVLAYLKKATNIKIIYFNHASHFPSLGMSFADVILEGMPTTEKVTNEKRGFSNTKIIGLQSLAKGETKYFSKDELNQLKNNIGISKDNLVTMSGASSYKFFDNNDSSYFKMIKNLLKKEPRLIHVIISEFNDKQKSIIDNIFEDAKDIKKRLIFVPYQTNFDKYFQCADVFIDSFPVSSALTQIDLMRNKVASVVKINKETPEFSFHEYQMPDYPYMFEKVDDMEKAILELLHNVNKRREIIEKNYDFWLKTYESSVVRDKYIKIIEAV